jgi:hypothetical protein
MTVHAIQTPQRATDQWERSDCFIDMEEPICDAMRLSTALRLVVDTAHRTNVDKEDEAEAISGLSDDLYFLARQIKELWYRAHDEVHGKCKKPTTRK